MWGFNNAHYIICFFFIKIKVAYPGDFFSPTCTFWSHSLFFTWLGKSHKIEADGDSFLVPPNQIEIAKINIGPKLRN